MMAQQSQEAEGSSQIDVKEWLKANKLEKFVDAFISKNIAIEEIADFEENDLNNFMVELKFDILSKKRPIKAIGKMRQQNIAIAPSASVIRRRVIVSSEEQRAIEQLSARFDECIQQQQLIQRTLNDYNLDKAYNSTINAINIAFEVISKSINDKKHSLLQQIDIISCQKQSALKDQLNALQTEYIPMIESGKKEYDAYSKGASVNLNIVSMVKDILSFNGKKMPTTSMTTAPTMKFDIYKSQNICSLFMKKLKIDDCDKPNAPNVRIDKVESDMISIRYDIKKEYYASINKPILKISIQCALIKNDDNLWSEKEEKVKFDDNESSSNDDSSDSTTESEETGSEDEGNGTFSKARKMKERRRKIKKAKKIKKKEKKKKKQKTKEPQPRIELIERSKIENYDDLKWMIEDKEITQKSKKIDKKFRIQENIKSNKTYAVKVKLLNESGMSEEPTQIWLIKTQKFPINSKILKYKEQIKLQRMIDKRMKKKDNFRKYKLLYRASRDGWGMIQFHKKCIEKGETLTIVRTTKDNVFGGYRSKPFKNQSGNGPDPKAFIYLIRSSLGKKAEIFDIMDNNHSQYAIYDYAISTNGVMIGFGGGHDIGINVNANTNSLSYANKHSYNLPSPHHLNGTSKFMVKEIEVFRIYH